MKKLVTTLSAIVALLLIASPVMASAETIDVMALQLSDPVVYYNGEPIADMSGLMLQLAGGSTADGSLTQVFVDLFAGGQNINSAMFQLDDNGLAGYLGGMTSAYGVSPEDIGALPIEGLEVSSVDELIAALENWTLFDDFAALIGDFSENGFTYGDPETIDVDLAAGTTSMTYVSMTADFTAFTYSLLALLENDAILGELFTSMAADSGYSSFTDMFEEGGLSYTFSGGSAFTDDGSSTMIEGDYVITMYEEPVHMDMNVLMDGSMGDTQYLTVTANMYPESSDESVTMTVNGVMTGDDVAIDGVIATNFSDEGENVEVTFSLTYASAAGAGAGTDKLDISVAVPGEGDLSLSAYAVEATGESHMEVSVKDDYTDVSAYFTFAPAAVADASVLMAGTIEIGMSDGADTYSVAAPVQLIATSVDTDSFYIAPEYVIDVMTMTDEQMQTAQSEMQILVIQMLTQIEEAVPSLEGLTAGLTGYTQQ